MTMNRHTFITYAAAAGNIGLWVMAGILSEGGQIHPLVKVGLVGFSAFALGFAMAFGLVEIAAKMASLPAEFERTKKDGTTSTKPNRRYQIARAVLVSIIGGESLLLMPVVVALATGQGLAQTLPGGWLWLWAFGRVAMAAALLAGLSSVMETHPQKVAQKVAPVAQVNEPEPQPTAQDVAPAAQPEPLELTDANLLAQAAQEPKPSQAQLAQKFGVSRQAIGARLARLRK